MSIEHDIRTVLQHRSFDGLQRILESNRIDTRAEAVHALLGVLLDPQYPPIDEHGTRVTMQDVYMGLGDYV